MSQNQSSAYQIVMPRLGLTMTEAKIVEWLKAEGEWVEKGSLLFVIENDKSTVEIEAPIDGYLHILTPVDVTVPVLTPVGLLSGGERVSGHHAAPEIDGARLVAEAPPAPGLLPGFGDSPRATVRASPKARALARKLGVALAGLSGSGLRSMVIAEDVQRATSKPMVKASPIAQRVALEAGLELSAIPASGSHGWIMRQDVERVVDASRAKPSPPTELPAVLPLSGLRAIIAERLSQSWRERPQVTLTTEADATNLVAARQQLNAELAGEGEKISYNALLIKLTAQTLHEQPHLNVQLTENGLQVMPEINIGLAMDSERGLLVPVVRDAWHKTIRQVNQEIGVLADRALKGRSLPDDLVGGTFTITNLGAYEIDAFTPIINPPECAILGVGRIISKPVGLNGQIVLREMISLSLSFDHRLVDGAPAARFLQRIKQLVERPFSLALWGG
jgi:pyruvate dehydrogenase E2 component (dihydrolipoamide acetyltransferase)